MSGPARYPLKLRGYVTLREAVARLAEARAPDARVRGYLAQRPITYEGQFGPAPDDDEARRVYAMRQQRWAVAGLQFCDPFVQHFPGEEWTLSLSALDDAKSELRQALWEGIVSALIFYDGKIQFVGAEDWGSSPAESWIATGHSFGSELYVALPQFESWLAGEASSPSRAITPAPDPIAVSLRDAYRAPPQAANAEPGGAFKFSDAALSQAAPRET